MEAVNSAHRLIHRVRLALVLVGLLVMACPQSAPAEPREQEVKAALIFNITRFVEWPENAFRTPSAPLVVAIMGQDDVGDVLGTMLLRKTVNGHPFEVRHVHTVDEARKCHVLYLASSEKRRAEAILEELRGAGTLTVADFEHFAERGGHVNLLLVDQRVRVFVNPTSVEDSHLKISAKLLAVAQIVTGSP